jgi:anti-sigma factor RsiW
MDCPLTSGNGAEVFIAYSAGTLPSETEAAFQQHLEACADCRRIAEVQREVWFALDAFTPAPVSSTFDEKLYARIAAEEQKPRWQRMFDSLSMNWSWKPAMPVAAACTALLAAFLLKGPVPEHLPQASVQPKVDIEQVERALDDLDMLKQLGLAASAPAGQPAHSTSM